MACCSAASSTLTTSLMITLSCCRRSCRVTPAARSVSARQLPVYRPFAAPTTFQRPINMSPVSLVAEGPATVDIRASSLADSTAAASLSEDQRNQIISDSIRGIPDFPKPGILFWDVTTLLLNPQAFQLTIDAMVERYKDQNVDVVAGFEARGLIFGAPLALALGVAFVPLRKPGKLPGETICESYDTEYSTDKIEMHTGAINAGQRVLLVDDLIATGGTLRAGINLMGKVGAEVVEAACIIELPALKGRAKLGDTKLFVLIEKEGE